MSVNSHLTSLASSLVLSGAEQSNISTSIGVLSSRLNTFFGSAVTNQFRFGSSTRDTILPRRADSNSDIDYMVVFDTSSGTMKPQTYLDRLRRFAESKYGTSEIHQSHPTVVLSLNHIKFDLVPAIYEYAYQIPSPAKSYLEWMHTDPTGTNTQLQEKNKANGFHIKPLVRLIKYWNARNNHPFTAFSIEQNIVEMWFSSCTSLKDCFYQYWSNVNYPIGSAQSMRDKVNLAKQRASVARNYEDQDMPMSAESEIKKIVPPL